MTTCAAEIDGTGLVLRVIVIPDAQASRAQAFCADDLKLGGTWVVTFPDARARKNYAGPGYRYDAGRDAFIPAKPYPSWTLDETTARWKAPVDYPQDGKDYRWDEARQGWGEVR